MIRYKGFKGFFIMKKNAEGKWEYLSKYSKKGDRRYFSFSDSEVRYFPDSSIKSGLPWDVFSSMIYGEFKDSPVVLYVMIDNKIIRVKYYNPLAEQKIVNWYRKEDFYCYAPQKEFK